MSIRKSVVISFADQALLSLANFLIGVFLIKNSAKEDYGMYVFAYAIILFMVSVQNALVTNQMTVMAPNKKPEERDYFCTTLAVGQYLVVVPLAFVGMVLIGIIDNLGLLDSGKVAMAYAVAVAILGVLLREFIRVFFFLKLNTSTVLLLDFFHSILMLAGLWMASILVPNNLHMAAILIFGAASAVSGISACFLSKFSFRARWMDIQNSLGEAWKNGRWALGGVVLTLLESQSYVYILTAISGAASTAEVNAARLFLMPVALLNVSVARVLMPRWGGWRAEGRYEHIISSARKALMLIVASILVYLFVLLWVKDLAIEVLLTKAYAGIGVYIMLWGVYFVLVAIRTNQSILLQVYEDFRAITLASIWSMMLVLSSSLVLIQYYGVPGSILAMICGEIILTTLLTRRVNHVIG